mgnify:CR=1 FL=1
MLCYVLRVRFVLSDQTILTHFREEYSKIFTGSDDFNPTCEATELCIFVDAQDNISLTAGLLINVLCKNKIPK